MNYRDKIGGSRHNEMATKFSNLVETYTECVNILLQNSNFTCSSIVKNTTICDKGKITISVYLYTKRVKLLYYIM